MPRNVEKQAPNPIYLMHRDLAVPSSTLANVNAEGMRNYPFLGGTMANIMVMEDEQVFVLCVTACSATKSDFLLIRDLRRV